MLVKIHLRGVLSVDAPDSVSVNAAKSGKWRLSYSDDETRFLNDTIRNFLRQASFEEDRFRTGTSDLHYHSLFGGREYPPTKKEAP